MNKQRSTSRAIIPSALMEQTETSLVPRSPYRPPALSATPDAMGLLRALCRRWKIGLTLGLITATLAGAVTWCVVPKPKHTARATLNVASNPKYIIFDPKERLADYRTYQRNQVALAKSRYVLAHALKKPEIVRLQTVRERDDAEGWLSQQIKVGFTDASEVLEFSLSGDRPADLAKIVNAVVDSYLILIVQEEQNERRSRLDKLKALWNRYQVTLQAKRKQLRELSEAIGTHDKQTLSVAHQSKLQHLELAEQEQMRVRFELKKAEAELAAIKESVARADQAEFERLVEDQLEDTGEIQDRKEMIHTLMAKYDRAAAIARKESDPAVRAAQRRLNDALEALEESRKRLRPLIAARVRNEESAGDRASRDRLAARINAAKIYLESIATEISRLRTETQVINRSSMDLSQQQDEIQIAVDTARKIGAEVEAMDVELEAPERIRVLDRATTPVKKDAGLKLKLSAGAALGTLVLALAGVSFWEFRARRIHTIEEVVDGLGLSLVGTLPAFSVPPNQPLALDNEKGRRRKELLVESVDAVRTMILHASRVEPMRLIMVTSAETGEGKTSLSWHLASSLARAGRRTLLLDGDLRCPDLHRHLNASPEPGLSELLRGETDLSEAIRPTADERLDLIPAGRCDALARQSLAQDHLRVLFDELKTRYDFIIVDSAPVLSVTDSLLVSQYVDATIFSILRNRSRVPRVFAAHERLEALGVRMLGAVISGVTGEVGYGSDYLDPDRRTATV